MGMYTELIFGARLKKDVPSDVVEVLKYMTSPSSDIHTPPKQLPDHGFFELPRWTFLFKMSSYYFGVSESHASLVYDDIDNQYFLETRSNIKNYDGEIESFIDWIRPYIDYATGGRNMFAVVCYEEAVTPDIYFLDPNHED